MISDVVVSGDNGYRWNPGQGVIFGVNGTGDKFIASNNDTREKIITGVVYTSEQHFAGVLTLVTNFKGTQAWNNLKFFVT